MDISDLPGRLMRARDRAEARLALLAGTTMFALLSVWFIIKPVRDAYFTQKRPIEDMAGAYLITAVVTLAVSYLVNLAAARCRTTTLVAGFYLLSAPLFAGIRGWIHLDWPYGPEILWAWAGAYGVVAMYVFWALCNELFSAEQASRMYGPIGVGGALGATAGGLLGGLLAEQIGARNLVYVAIGLQLVSALAAFRLAAQVSGSVTGRLATRKGGWEGLRAVLRSPYLRAVLAIVVLSNFADTFVDYHWKATLKRGIDDEDARASLQGYFLAGQTILTLLLNLLLVPLLQMRRGPLPGLLLAVAFHVLTASALGLDALLGGGAGLALTGALCLPLFALRYSVHQSAKELLYAPLQVEDKYKAKVYGDAFGWRLGDALAAILLWGGRGVVATPAGWLLLTLPALLARGFVAVRVVRRFHVLSKEAPPAEESRTAA